ncbi:MAG: hypothetical protein IKW45_05165 [Clostridia bacterium]|nr:hypothetical protein [Clostridia bacterium]
MKCENLLCIYQNNNNCTNKSELEIDWHGLCKNMVPVRISRNDLNSNKFITQLELNDGNHLFDKEIGKVVLTDEAFELYDKDF